MIPLNEPLSDREITELDEFLTSDATPEECMDIVALDGFLTALLIGPGLVPPSVWLETIWGKSEPRFDSSAQAQRLISLIMRRFNAIGGIFEEPPEFAPILYEREIEGKVYRIAEDWCWGFLTGLRLAAEAWQPLLEDQDHRQLLLPIITLGSEEGWKLLEADTDPEAAEEAALADLESSVVAISRYWRGQWKAAVQEAAIRPRSLRVRRNEPCPCGSGRKYKRCCANARA
jgi:uncharacterized protein